MNTYEQQAADEKAAYEEANGKLPTVVVGGIEYRFVKVDYRFWHPGRGWQIDGETDDGVYRRYRYDDGGKVIWRQP